MSISRVELNAIVNAITPVSGALALSALTANHDAADTFTGTTFQEEYDIEVERIVTGFIAALNGEEGAVDEPEDYFVTIGLDKVLAALEVGE